MCSARRELAGVGLHTSYVGLGMWESCMCGRGRIERLMFSGLLWW